MRWIFVLVLSCALGAAAAMADTVASHLVQPAGWRAAGMILNAGSVWAGLAVLSGWIVLKPSYAAVAGVVGLLSAVAAYYLWGMLFGDRSDVGFSGLSGVVRAWALVAVFVGPVLGIAGTLIRRRDHIGLIAALAVPVGALVEVFVVRHLDRNSFDVDPTLAWAQTAIVLAAVLGVGWAITRLLRLPSPVSVEK